MSYLVKRRFRIFGKIIFYLFSLVVICYFLATFTETPILSEARTLWIETAMTTGEHQWLAKIFPQSVINKVMSQQVKDVNGIAGLDISFTTHTSIESNSNTTEIELFPFMDESLKNILFDDKKIKKLAEAYNNLLQEREDKEAAELAAAQAAEAEKEAEANLDYWWDCDPLFQKPALQSGKDETGREVIYNDLEQGIMISLVQTASYTARVVRISDPSRVFIATTDKKGVQGKLICDYLEDYDAILGINASGFVDTNGNGSGGSIIGQTMASGALWGDHISSSITVGLDAENRLLAGYINDWNAYNLRDAFQFGPVLIQNGEILTEGSAGWGLQPRTVIAQRSDGAIMFLVVDGRKVGYSIGATMGDCAEILKEYGAVTAAACDGGSSSVLAYNGEIINIPSTPMTTGRYLPNAILVKRH